MQYLDSSKYVLPDIIRPHLNLVMCGYNAGKESADEGHYYFDRRNRFWRTLYDCGLTSKLLKPEEDESLPDYGIGLTDLMKQSVNKDHRFPTEQDIGRLRELLLKHQPKILAFLGKRPAEAFLSAKPKWGFNRSRYDLGLTRIFLVPDTSGGNGHFDRLKYLWFELTQECGNTGRSA